MHEFLFVFGDLLEIDLSISAEEPLENFNDAKACEAKDGVPDDGPAHRLNGCVKEVFEGSFNDIHLLEVLAGFKVLVLYLAIFTLSTKGRG